MERARALLYLSVFLSLLSDGRAQNALDSQDEQSLHRDLVEALEDLLEGDQDNRISVEKKASVIPRCDMGERCAMKHGPRIGRLCDCMRGTACNTFFLRCY